MSRWRRSTRSGWTSRRSTARARKRPRSSRRWSIAWRYSARSWVPKMKQRTRAGRSPSRASGRSPPELVAQCPIAVATLDLDAERFRGRVELVRLDPEDHSEGPVWRDAAVGGGDVDPRIGELAVDLGHPP